MAKTTNKIEKTVNHVRGVLQSLQRESGIFLDATRKFKAKLPRDQFMCSCADVLRQLKFLMNMNDIELIKDTNDIVISDSLLEVSARIAKQSHYLNEVCLKAFSLCEQRMKLGFFAVAYSFALGVLARLYSLSKALSLLAARLSYDLKRKLSFVSNSKEPNIKLRDFGFYLLKSIGYSDSDLHLITRDDQSFEEANFDEMQDLGVVISRDEQINLSPSLPSFPENEGGVNDEEMEFPSNSKDDSELSRDSVPFSNIKNLRDLKEACRKAVKSGASLATKAQVKTIFSETVERVKKLKAKGKKVKAKKEVAQAVFKMKRLLVSSLKETAARSKGYQSISDDESFKMEQNEDEDFDFHLNDIPAQTESQNSESWTKKKIFLKTMKKAESVKEMLSTWKQMMRGQREDLNELIPSSVSKKDRIQIKKILTKTSKIASTIKPQLQVKKTSRKIVSLIEDVLTK